MSFNNIIETGPLSLVKDTSLKFGSLNGMYSTLPNHYSETNKNYQLLVFIHGAGQIGHNPDDLTSLTNDGIAQYIYIQKFPPNLYVNGTNFSFIILNPQFNRYPSSDDIETIILYARETYWIDTNRIYLSGLSMGGFVTTQTAGDYTSQIAAIVPISGVTNDSASCRNIANGKLPVRAFHNNRDTIISIQTAETFISLIDSFKPKIVPRLTIFNSSAHDAWTAALNPLYKEEGKNIYEWMLTQSK